MTLIGRQQLLRSIEWALLYKRNKLLAFTNFFDQMYLHRVCLESLELYRNSMNIGNIQPVQVILCQNHFGEYLHFFLCSCCESLMRHN